MQCGLILAVWALVCAQAALGQGGDTQAEMQKALEEFKVQSRELGLRADSPKENGAGGAAGVRWHGRVYENLRNDFLDAVPHEITQGGGTKSLLRRNQFGFNLAGPLVIPKLYRGQGRTFLSVSYEGVREGTSRSFLDTIPTVPERTGDFSAVVDAAGEPLPVFDPATTRANPAFQAFLPVSRENLEHPRDPFPGNRIAASRLDGISQALLDYYPAPNAAIGPFDRNNYFLVDPETNDANGVIINADHSIGQRHRLSVETAFSKGLEQPARRLLSGANPGAPERSFRNRRGSLSYVFTRSPRTVWSVYFMADTDISSSGEQTEPDYAGKIGLRGSSALAFPAFYFEPYLSMGRYAPRSKSSRTAYVWESGYSVRLDKHSLRFTSRHRREQLNVFSSRYPAGYLRFSDGLTSLPGIVNTGHGFASFLLGLPDYAEKTYVVSPSYFRRYSWFAAVREQYEARKGLTFSFNLSLATYSPRVEKYDRQSTVDLTVLNPANGRPGAMVVAGRDGRGRAFHPRYVKLQPSAGVTWNPGGDPKMVLRAGYGRDYGPGFINANQWGTQAFNASPSYVSPNAQLDPAFRLADGIPPLGRPLPDFRPDAVNDTTADLADASGIQPTYQGVNGGVERRFSGAVVVAAGFSIDTGRNIFVGSNAVRPNAVPLSALTYRDQLNDDEFNRSLRPYPQYRSLEIGGLWPAGKYQRKGGFVSTETRGTGGLVFNARFDFSRQWDDYSGGYGRQDYFDRRKEWSLSAFNSPRRLSFSYIYELPFGAGKPLLSISGWRGRLVEGWAVSGSSSFMGGEPILLRPLFNNTGGVVPGLRVNVVEGENPHVANPGPALWFNSAAFDQPPDFTIGNGPRTHPTLRNPMNQNHDLSVTKRIALASETTMEFSLVGLNFLNHANWSDPDPVIGPASAPNVNAGKIIGSRGGRVLQLGLRIGF